jgi:signal transduction histidine kinase
MELIGWPQARWSRFMRGWMTFLCAIGILAATAAWVYILPLALTVWYGALGLTFLLFSAGFAWISVSRSKDPASIVFALAIVVNVVVGLADFYLLRVRPSIVGSSALYFSSVLFGVAASVVVLMRFKAATLQATESQANMALQVAQKEQELNQTYLQMADLERQQARSSERSLILREMHDGVGMHLSTAMRQLQSGKASDQEVLNTLHESLDQLKLSIDAMNLPPGDITALLANLRYRLEPRLKASDIDLQWGVDLIAPVERLDDKAMRQLQFIVYEALSNVMQHARATSVRIEASSTGPGVRLRVVDNGCGFDASQPWRKGLMSMRDRAAGIGGSLVLQSVPGNTVVEIQIA